MQRYFVSSLTHEITGPDAHHITKVMRMKSGDEVVVCGLGRCFLVKLKIEDHKVFYTEKEEYKKDLEPKVTLIQGLPKHPKGETVSKYATLFGVSEIKFVPMIRSIAKPDNEANKLKRLELIIKEAAELAHRFDVPSVSFETSLKTIDWKKFSTVLVAYENEKTLTLPIALPNVSYDDHIAIVIGPEGGISDQEIHYFESLQAKMVSLGKRILPTELAALYALTYISLQNAE